MRGEWAASRAARVGCMESVASRQCSCLEYQLQGVFLVQESGDDVTERQTREQAVLHLQCANSLYFFTAASKRLLFSSQMSSSEFDKDTGQ